ncbi:MAG: type II secretion system protein GspD [Burkholderiales bacterium RIFCSPLOWO2_02_FULL_57_36]|nr:MAG: type II secretion system protein GspD [Burkholderiales bacterium RIFCSPLOWO2_02_FULL_57_36]
MKTDNLLAATFPRKQTAWRRIGAAVALLCAISTVQPLRAQDPTSNQATLNFVGAEIESVVKAIGHYTNTTFIIDPRVKGTINLVSEKPVSKAQAFQLLTSALRLQGYAVVAGDGFTKVVPEADAKLQAGPIQAGAIRGDQIATQIFRLNYESAGNLVPVLRPLISPNNTINANPGNNTLVITDYADNLRRLGRIIAALDGPATSDLDVVPIRHAVASDIATMVNRLLDGGGAPGAPGAGSTSLLADSRTNAVIIRAPSAARANLAKSLIARLDQPTAQPGNVHVIYLKNAEATKLAQILRAVVASDVSATGSSAQASQQTPQQPQQQQVSGGGLGSQIPPSSPAPAQGPLPTGGPGGFIQADPSTNTLIITASEAVYRNLRVVVDQLDARRAQVYIESLIVEVTSDKAAEFGVQWASLSGDANSRYRVGTVTGFTPQGSGNNLISQTIAALGPTGITTPPGNGLNLGIFRQVGGQLTLGAIARALETDDKANILSMPNLVTLDNEEARIIVGQNVPFVTGQFTTPASGGAAGVNPFQTIERKDIGLSLRVRPQISEGGTVKMAIYQETSNIQENTASGLITTKRSIDTNVLVDDGQIIVLGGLIEDNWQNGEEKVPGLGDIPVVGNLFKYQQRSRVKTNLMVFLRPIVIRNNDQGVNLTADRYGFIRGKQLEAQPDPTIILSNTGAPVLPPLQDGRVVGGTLYRGGQEVQGNTPQPVPPQVPPQQQPLQQPGTSN